MHKNLIVDRIIEDLQLDISNAEAAAHQAHEGAVHDQSKAETQYDTLGLEHAYLAEGQGRRILELKAAIVAVRNMPLTCNEKDNDNEIVLSSFFLLEPNRSTHHALSQQASQSPASSQTKTQHWFFLSCAGGGLKLSMDAMALGLPTILHPNQSSSSSPEIPIQVISPTSPLAEEVLGRGLEEQVTLPNGDVLVISQIY